MKQPDFADFGNFIHKVFEEYSSHKDINITSLGKRVLDEYNYSNFTKNLWWPKFLNISAEFIKFEESRRMRLLEIYTEIEGFWNIDLGKDRITLTAKADRIELTKDYKINILDYKTGAVPLKKDVALGIAPQLLIEEMIIANGGFSEFCSKEVGELLYVKISASKPHVKGISIELNSQIKKDALLGLTRLLKFYLDDNFIFSSIPNKKYAPKYNDYQHLARYIVI